MTNNIFNLTKFLKEAMGAPNVRYRSARGGEYMWYDLEEVKAGENPAWLRHKAKNPSLETVETEIISFEKDMMATFRARYGLPVDEIRKFFKVWIAYNPNYGAYLCSVGPYRYNGGAKDATKAAQLKGIDESNRFSFFTKRYQFADENTINEAYEKYVEEKLSLFSDVLDITDFDFDLKSANGFKENGDIQWGTTSINTDATSPEMEFLRTRKVFMGSDSQMNINEKGLSKVIKSLVQRENLGDVMAQAIQSVALKMRITPEQVSQMVETGEGENAKSVLKSLFNTLENFFPIIIRRQARNNGWEDVLTQAVATASATAIKDINKQNVTIPEERIWEILGENVSGDENSPVYQERQYGDNRQAKANSHLRAKLIENIIGNINKAKSAILKRNLDPKTGDVKVITKGRNKDTAESIARKRQEVEKARSINPMPTQNSFGKSRAGAQKPIALGVRTSHKSLLKLKEEILRYLSGQDLSQPINFEQIAAAMTASREGSKSLAQGGVWTANDVANWVERITEELNETSTEGRETTFADLLQQTERDIAELSNEEIKGSFPDFDTAARMASIYFMEADFSAIDSGTRMVKTVDYRRPPPVLQRDEGAPNITAEQLTAVRRTHSDEAAVPAANRGTVATPEDIESQIGSTPDVEPSAPEVEPVEEPAAQPAATPDAGLPGEQEPVGAEAVPSPEVPQPKPKRMKKFLQNTLGTLIKIAEELDNEGKTAAAEEIHLIIRKYLG